MSIWLELHCDYRIERYTMELERMCMTDENENISRASGHRSHDLLKAKRALVRQAKAAGWKQIQRKWCCPRCQKRLRERSAQT